MAAQCCKLTDLLITQCDSMWLVPQRLIDQARHTATAGPAAKRQSARKTLSLSPQTVKVTTTTTAAVNAKTMSGILPAPFHSKHAHKIVI